MVAGVLYIVATPIGNLDDITLRAINCLKTVDVIACEDTRHSKKLLQHFSIDTPLLAFHEHNESEKTPILIERLQQGDSVALISDAGTPLINDPGYRLVHAAKQAGICVSPLPGACAAISALSVSGLPSHAFAFLGFLPAKQTARENFLQSLDSRHETMIFYEAPHRLLESLHSISKVFGDGRQVCLARELTKVFETVLTGTINEVLSIVEADAKHQKGEVVLLVEGVTRRNASEDFEQAQKVLHILSEEVSHKTAVKLAAKICHVSKNKLYEIAKPEKNG